MHELMKLGKKAAKPWPLKLASFIDNDVLPVPPPSFSNSRGITQFGMMLNHFLGCCVIAAKFHALQSFVLSQIDPGVPQDLIDVISPSDDLILRYYEQWAGYVDGDPSTDNGMDETTSWQRWLAEGLANYKILGFADPDPQNILHIKQSIALFGGVDIGLQMPVEWQNAKKWDVVKGADRGSWGGHDTWVMDYTDAGVIVCTWGALQLLTWDGLAWAADEAHTAVSQDFSPRDGFDLEGLQASLQAIKT